MLLYKYCPPERADFLKERLIRFTQPGLFNDPFDSLPAVTGYTKEKARAQARKVSLDIAVELALGDFSRIDPRMNMAVLNRAAAELEEEYAADPTAVGLKYLAALRNRMFNDIGILCLSEDRSNILMWSHYAKNHSGFAIGFDSEHSFFSHRDNEPEEIGQLRKVVYVKQRPCLHLSTIENEGPVPDFLFSKNADWSYELEWRIIRFLKTADSIDKNNVHLFGVPPSAIREIIFGCLADENTVNKLEAASKNPDMKHVNFFRADLSRVEYEMDIVPPTTRQHFKETLAWLRSPSDW